LIGFALVKLLFDMANGDQSNQSKQELKSKIGTVWREVIKAKHDLQEIRVYLASDDPIAADKLAVYPSGALATSVPCVLATANSFLRANSTALMQ